MSDHATPEGSSAAAWSEVSRLFDHAVELKPAHRQAFLDREAPDPQVRLEVETLLASEPGGDRLFATSAFDTAARLLLDGGDLNPGTTIGAYRVVSRLAAGGMGTVYLGERCDQAYRKQVAIKVIHSGLASPDLRRLFRQERQILATLNHPAIARLLDGGELADGRPYLVMEVVEGCPIDRYCHENRLSSEDKIRLFLGVCEAVRSAHSKLVIHQDLKPSNILVTPEGGPKLIDFGTAQLLGDGGWGDDSPPDEVMFATPEYASPEQSAGGSVTTATDVYGLAVVLFLLLTGSLPEAGSQPCRGQRLASELESVLDRALEPNPRDRYATVDELIRDLRRYLERRPVSARPRSLARTSWLCVRRHPRATLAMVAGLAATFIFVVALRNQRDQASAALVRAEQASRFAVDLFEGIDPGVRQGEPLTARGMLDRGRRLLAEMTTDDRVRLQIGNGLARRYLKLGEAATAASLLHTVRGLEGLDTGALEIAESEALLGRAILNAGDWDQAVTHLEGALEVLTGRSPRADRIAAGALADLAEVRTRQGELELARDVLERALELGRQSLDSRDPELGRIHSIAGYHAFQAGQLGLAEAHHGQALELATERGGPRHPAVADALGDLALIYRRKGDGAAALSAARRALEIQRDAYGLEHPAIAVGHHNLGALYLAAGRFASAKEMLELAMGQQEELAALDPLAPKRGRRLLAYANLFLGSMPEAERWSREALETGGDSLPPEEQARSLLALAHTLCRVGDWPGAEAVFQQALSLTVTESPGDFFRQRLVGDYGRELIRRGRVDEASRWLEEVAETKLEEASSVPSLILARAAQALMEGDSGGAESRLLQGERSLDKDPEHPWHAEWAISRSVLDRSRGDLVAAASASQRALEVAMKCCGDRGPLTAQARLSMALVLMDRGEIQEARELLERVAAVLPPGADRLAMGSPSARQLLKRS